MRAIVLIIIFICSCITCISAQSLKLTGQVVNQLTRQPVAFASIGVKGKSIGTISDEQGRYSFTVPESQASGQGTVIISSIGYYSLILPLHTFKITPQLELIPAATQLQPVTVKPQKVKPKTYGRTASSTFMVATMFTQRDLVNDNLGKEQAAVLNVDKNCYLKAFNMYVVNNQFRQVKFRLNLYSVKDGYPDSLIIKDNILFEVTQQRGWVTVDLKPYQIYLNGYRKVAVAIQWLKSEKTDSTSKFFTVSATMLPGHATYFRDKSQADWQKISSAYVSFNLSADYFKSDQQQPDGMAPETEPELNDSLKNLAAYAKYAEEAAATLYGRNAAAGHYMHLSNADIYYEIYGKGQPLLLLHGNGQSIAALYRQISELSKHYQVIAADTRAQGRSTDTLNYPLSYQLFAADMKALLDTLHLKKVNILGWSDGGITGLLMAMQYPAYVNKLAVTGANIFPQGVAPGVLNTFRQEYQNIQNSNRNAADNRQRLLKLMLTEPQLNFNQLKAITVPVLVMAGDQDVILPEHTQAIAKAVPGSQLMIFKNATHYAPQETPAAFNEAVLNFFK